MTERNTSADKEVMDFLAEAEEIVDQLVTELGEVADSYDRNDVNPELINSIFRAAHSLKGISGMFGYRNVSELSHNLESLLENLRLGRIQLDERVLNVLFETAELLNQLIRAIPEGGIRDFSSEIAAALSNIDVCLGQEGGDKGESLIHTLGLPERILSSLTEYEEHRLKYNLEKGFNLFSVHVSYEMTTFDQDLSLISSQIKSSGELISTLPGIGDNIETHIDFDLLFSSELQLDEISSLPGFDNVGLTQLNKPSVTVSSLLTGPVSVAAPPQLLSTLSEQPPPPVESPRSSKSMSGTVRVDIGKLDELMNIVGELVQSHSSISVLAASMRNEGFSRMGVELSKAAKVLERRLADLQKGVLEIRLVPVGQLYEKMSRIVRKISREQRKKVELAFLGSETELDKLLVEDISDPMMHIIRNAIDHGIEMPEQRVRMGKSERGLIRISSYQKGSSVTIEIEDDGNGIDIESVKNRALQKGLVKDIENISDKEALEIIFLPGFSTAESVSEVSGRGVGMDVVKNNIAAISGTVDVETTPGVGSRFTITLPITLAIIKVLIVSAASRIYAMPISSVRETLLLKSSDIETVEQKKVVTLRSSTIPLVWLDRFLGFESLDSDPNGELFVVIVGSAEKRIGIVVDDLLGQQDVVIKSLGEAFKDYHGISGAADLGDQGTILVLDVAGIISESRKSGN